MLLVAALLMIPVVSVLSNVLRAGSGTWQHLSQTVLPEYLFNTVGRRRSDGLAGHHVPLSDAPHLRMGANPAAGLSSLRHGLHLYRLPPAGRPPAISAAGPYGTELRRLLVPGGSIARRRRSDVDHGALSLRLSPGAGRLLREQSVCALEVSRTLGCTAWSSFLRVALPLARPAIVAGTALALMETLADFGTVSFFGIPTFTTGIVRAWVSFGDPVSAAQLSSSLLALVFIVLLLEHWSRRRSRYHHTSSKYQHLPGYRLRGVRRFLAFMACALPLFFGFILPASILVKSSFESAAGQAGGRFFGLVWNTVTLAATTAVLAVLLATLLAYSLRLTPSTVSRLAARLASMGYAVPGTVIAVGVLIPFAAFDNWLDALLGRLFGISTGLLLTGSIAALVFAYLVRFLAVSLNTVEASLGKVKPTMDDAARALGTGPVGTLRRVHIPIMRTSLLTAALVVFVDVMKELPATLVMRPFNFDTLAVRAHNLASDERLSEAGLPSLAIVAVGIPPLILLSRAIAGARPGSRKRL
jgi:iron(III) transport system permease protein